MEQARTQNGVKRYRILNLSRKEYLAPEIFAEDENRLLGFVPEPGGIMCGMAALLSDGNGRGGGDLHSENPIVGSWAGGNIEIRCVTEEDLKEFRDVSISALQAITDDSYKRKDQIERVKKTPRGSPARKAMRMLGLRLIPSAE